MYPLIDSIDYPLIDCMDPPYRFDGDEGIHEIYKGNRIHGIYKGVHATYKGFYGIYKGNLYGGP